jgi:hypothetical protein
MKKISIYLITSIACLSFLVQPAKAENVQMSVSIVPRHVVVGSVKTLNDFDYDALSQKKDADKKEADFVSASPSIKNYFSYLIKRLFS